MKIKGKDFYALLCNCSKYGDKDLFLCGVYATRKEAEVAAKEAEGCPAKHSIRKCSVEIETKK